MSYRIHRFSSFHLAREVGDGGTNLYNAAAAVLDTESASEPWSRLYDDQTKRLVAAGGDGTRVWILDMHNGGRVLPASQAITRMILPYPHSLRSDGICMRLKSTPSGGWVAVNSDDGAALVWGGPPGDLVYDFETAIRDRYFIVEFLDGFEAASRARIGEWVFTAPEAPTTGVVYSWENDAGASNMDESVMLGGDSFVTVRGPDKRTFEVIHEAVTGADLRFYDALFAKVGTHTPFWYEHSDSGTQKEQAMDTGVTPSWAYVNATGALGTGVTGAGNTARVITSSASGLASGRHALWDTYDLRRAYMSIDIQLSTPAAIVANDDLLVTLEDTSTGMMSRWAIGRPIIGSQLSATWYRLFIDPTEDAESIISGSNGALELSAVDRITVAWVATAGSQTLTLGGVHVWHRDAMPVRCRFAQAPERRQDHRVPAGTAGPSYTLRMRLAEVTG